MYYSSSVAEFHFIQHSSKYYLCASHASHCRIKMQSSSHLFEPYLYLYIRYRRTPRRDFRILSSRFQHDTGTLFSARSSMVECIAESIVESIDELQIQFKFIDPPPMTARIYLCAISHDPSVCIKGEDPHWRPEGQRQSDCRHQ